jgi:hypothetical protein
LPAKKKRHFFLRVKERLACCANDASAVGVMSECSTFFHALAADLDSGVSMPEVPFGCLGLYFSGFVTVLGSPHREIKIDQMSKHIGMCYLASFYDVPDLLSNLYTSLS